jgi:hypothetical protein
MGSQFPGEPLGNMTYNRTGHGKVSRWGKLLFGNLFSLVACFAVFWAGYSIWGWWKGWVTIEVAGFSVESVVTKYWHLGTNIGPVYAGYGCKGFFWEAAAYSAVMGMFWL